MADKTVDCIYCKGRGWNYTNLMYQKECKECGGTGAIIIKEKRKPIQVDLKLHEKLSDMAHDHKTTLIGLMRLLAERGLANEANNSTGV